MEVQLTKIESAMETLIRSQSLYAKISKLPKCNYRESLLKTLREFQDGTEFTASAKADARQGANMRSNGETDTIIDPIGIIDSIRLLSNHCDVNDLSWKTQDKLIQTKVTKAMEELKFCTSTILTFIEKGSLSLE